MTDWLCVRPLPNGHGDWVDMSQIISVDVVEELGARVSKRLRRQLR